MKTEIIRLEGIGAPEITFGKYEYLQLDLAQLLSCGEISMGVKFDPTPWPRGQLLVSGEPNAMQGCDGVWNIEYPCTWVPVEPHEAWSFGGEIYDGPIVQEATE